MLSISMLLIFANLTTSNADTILLPLQNGIIRKEQIAGVNFDMSFNIAISPLDTYEVQSCSSGTVASIFSQDDGRLMVMIKNRNLAYGYVLDSPFVKVGQLLSKAEIIGKLKDGGEAENCFPLIFLVLKNGNFIDPRKFIIYKH
jgi:hypothetical protein